VLLLAVLVGLAALAEHSQTRHRAGPPATANHPQASPLTPVQAERLGRRHVACSRRIAQLSQAVAFPENVGQLPTALHDYLDASVTVPDLTSLGYTFDRAGPCHLAGPRSVHLIYRATDRSGREDALSLWIRPAEGATSLEPGRLYEGNDPTSAHPILIWRQGEAAYYLVGDNGAPLPAAANLAMRSAA
ncbi:MAG: hypothetical protein R3336_00075, partial [Phycisphaeraceae bacterium]|nr:hypothetical protein [Phycisphaeraceae bacterium]